MSHVFLSYAHNDADSAEALRLYEKLTAAGYPVWFDEKVLLVGQNWKNEIARAIRDSSAFIALISGNSVDHRGYVQKELRLALDVQSEIPANQIYLLPVRIADVPLKEPQLTDLHRLDLFRDREAGISQLLKAIGSIPNLKPMVPAAPQPADKAHPAIRSMADVFRIVLEKIPPATPDGGALNGFYLKLRTKSEGVEIPQHLVDRHPQEILVVLQHQYADLRCGDTSFSVTLWFSGEETRITVPYDAIVEISEPAARVRIA
jgi:hypothetical protein